MNRFLILPVLVIVAVLATGCEPPPDRLPLSRVSVADKQKQEAEAEAARVAAEQALKVKCVDQVDELMKSARALMKKNEPGDAFRMLFDCRYLLPTKESKDLLASAEKAMTAKITRDRLRSEKDAKVAKKKAGVSIGMSPQDVYDSQWRKPQSVNRTSNKYGVREQWVYGNGGYLYFQDGVLESVQN